MYMYIYIYIYMYTYIYIYISTSPEILCAASFTQNFHLYWVIKIISNRANHVTFHRSNQFSVIISHSFLYFSLIRIFRNKSFCQKLYVNYSTGLSRNIDI